MVFLLAANLLGVCRSFTLEEVRAYIDSDGRYLSLFAGIDGPILSGPIPAELGTLTNLTSIGLYSYVNISGPIPPELGNLTNLRSLSLSR